MKQSKKNQNLKLKDFENLLHGQTRTIFSALDKKLQERDERINKRFKKIENLLHDQTLEILSAVEERILKSEERVNKKIEKLTEAIDSFLKRTLDLEDEFEMMKIDLNRVKQVIRTKLGVRLD